MCEVHQLIQSDPTTASKPILFIYSDGGPDHRITFISVQLSLICLFRKLNLDYLCACRTAPYHSWRNPVERVMSILNLGLQCVGLARAEMPEAFENEVAKCNTLSEIRRIASRVNGFESVVKDSLSPVKVLLSDIFSRLQLHENYIKLFHSASVQEISDFWSALIAVDATLTEGAQYTKKKFANYTSALEFIRHCCLATHYAFDILKCGSDACCICKPIRLPADTFNMLKHLPHPTPGEDDHYAPFSSVFGTVTSGEHRPSYKKKALSKKNTLPFYASVQHVKNVELMVECQECGMWRLLYSKYKLNKHQRTKLQILLEELVYTCGAKLSQLQLPDEFKYVEIRDHDCHNPIEKLIIQQNVTLFVFTVGKISLLPQLTRIHNARNVVISLLF